MSDCQKCSELHDLLIAEKEKTNALVAQLATLHRLYGRAQTELKKIGKEEQTKGDRATIRFIFKRWQETCAGPDEDTRLGPKRADRIAHVLHASWGGRDRILKAIRGAASYPYVVGYERTGKGRPEQRKVKLSSILYDEEALEKFCGLADRADRVAGLHRRVPEAVTRLAEHFPVICHGDEMDVFPPRPMWFTTCPLHEAPEVSLSVTWGPDGKQQLRCLGRGCRADEIEAAIARLGRATTDQMELAA